MFCCHCGMSLPEGTKFCTRCGEPTVASTPEPPPYVPPEPPQGGTEYLGDGYVDEEEGTELLIPGTPWAPPRGDSGMLRTPPNPYTPIPQVADPSRKKRVSPVLIATVVLICLLGVAAIIVAVCLNLNRADAPKEEEREDPAGKTALSTVNWAYYEGLWTVDGASLKLEMDGEDVKLKLIDGALVIEGVCNPEGDSQRLDYEDEDGQAGTIVLTAHGDALQVTAKSDASGGFRCSGETAERGGPGAVVGAGPNSDLTPALESPAAVTVGDYLYYVNGQTVSQYPNPLPTVGGDFHFWPTDSVRITDSDLQKLTHEEIQAIRNEIYARYGFPFSGDRWKTLFGGMTWYTRNDNYVAPTLPQIVQDNVATITAYETAQGWR